MGTEPPLRLVPLPRAMNGAWWRWQSRTVRMTSSWVSGSTTPGRRGTEGGRPSDS